MPDRIPFPTELPIYCPGCQQWKWNAVLLGYWDDFEPIEVCRECWARAPTDPPKPIPPLPKIERAVRPLSQYEMFPITCARCMRTLAGLKWLPIVCDRATRAQIRFCDQCYRETTGEAPPADS
jgi:hypothetical protein